MLTIISKKVFRFPKPGAGILEPGGNLGSQGKFNDFYFDTVGGSEGGTKFGEPQQAPEWIKKDIQWERAFHDGDIAELTIKGQESAVDKSVKAAQKHADSLEEAPKLESMTKAEIVEHAKDAHGLELDESQTKALLIEAVEAAREEKAEQK